MLKTAGFYGLVAAFLGWLLPSVISYSAWRIEHDLKLYEGDLAQATKTFTDASDAFSKTLTLQQQLVYNYVDALDSNADKARTEFLWGQARLVLDEYRKARTELRETIGVLTRRAELFIDWPSAKDRNAAKTGALDDPLTALKVDQITNVFIERLSNPRMDKSKVDPLTVSAVEGGEVDCDSLIANGNDVDKWGTSPTSPGAKATVDWGSTKHHLIVLYACFAQDHNLSEPIRRWVSQEKSGTPPAVPGFLPAEADRRAKLVENFKSHFNLQTERLDKFNVLAMRRIERIQLNNKPPGYFCHTINIGCGSPG